MLAVGLIGTAQAMPVATPLGPIGYSGVSSGPVALPWDGAFSNDFSFSLLEGNSLQIDLTTNFYGTTPADAPEITFELLGVGSFQPEISAIHKIFAAGSLLTGLSQGTDYTLRVSGTDAGNLGLSYFLQLAPSMTVSEPDSYALLLGSLGLMALVARRRQSKQGVSA